jgi:hypothetical protein
MEMLVCCFRITTAELQLLNCHFLDEIYYYYYYLIELQMGFTWWQWYYNKTQHTEIHISYKITHHAQTKQHTQSYNSNEGHITNNEYNTKNKVIPVTGPGDLYLSFIVNNFLNL